MEIKAKIEQVSIDSYNIYKYTEWTPPSIYINDVIVFPESCGIFVKCCRSFEEARMIIDLNGWTYVEEHTPIVTYNQNTRKNIEKTELLVMMTLTKS